ncbi:hypothetical protein ABGB08_54135, partial [Acrocarpospora sp. B8E8]
ANSSIEGALEDADSSITNSDHAGLRRDDQTGDTKIRRCEWLQSSTSCATAHASSKSPRWMNILDRASLPNALLRILSAGRSSTMRSAWRWASE